MGDDAVSYGDRYRGPDDVPRLLPVFPLKGAILLPGAILPLSIFEPRYLTMFDDVMRGDRLIGIVQPIGAGGATGSPTEREAQLKRVGCVGRVTTYQEIDGARRLLITLYGIARFEIGGEIDDGKPYRTCHVSAQNFADDFAAEADEPTIDRVRLLETLKRYLSVHRMEADWSTINRLGDVALVNALAVASPFGPEEKQALLEAAGPAERAEILITLAEMELASGSDGAGGLVQ
jgi:Lon protease-like protein